MSRWLWALLGGVVVVAIAAVLWTASNQTNVTPPVSSGPAPVTPAPVTPAPVAPAPAPVAQKPAPSSAPAPAPTAQEATPAPPAAQEAAAPTAPAPAPAAPTPAPPSPPAAAPSAPSSAPPIIAQELPSPPAPAPLAEAPPPPPAPERPPPAPEKETQEPQGQYAPKSLAQLVGAWAYSVEDCDKLFERRGGRWAYRQPVDKFAQAAIVESSKKILLPSATCQIERASEGEGGLKVSAECADSISYTSRSAIIVLRSATELAYSASGDPVLATTLKKCAP